MRRPIGVSSTGSRPAPCRPIWTAVCARHQAERRSRPTTPSVESDLGEAADRRLQALASELDLNPSSLRDTLEAAMAIRGGRPQLACGEDTTCRLVHPGLPGWSDVVDESCPRRRSDRGAGSVARLAFSIEPFLEPVGERTVFKSRPDVLLMHLSHPMMQRALSALTRRRFPGAGEEVSRWTVRAGEVPKGADAVVLLSVEELAVNNLRETFHHWVHTVALPVKKGRLGNPLPHMAEAVRRAAWSEGGRPPSTSRAGDLAEDVAPALKSFVTQHAGSLTDALRTQLTAEGERARKDEDARYRSRQGEVSTLITAQTLERFEGAGRPQGRARAGAPLRRGPAAGRDRPVHQKGSRTHPAEAAP